MEWNGTFMWDSLGIDLIQSWNFPIFKRQTTYKVQRHVLSSVLRISGLVDRKNMFKTLQMSLNHSRYNAMKQRPSYCLFTPWSGFLSSFYFYFFQSVASLKSSLSPRCLLKMTQLSVSQSNLFTFAVLKISAVFFCLLGFYFFIYVTLILLHLIFCHDDNFRC